MYRSIAIAIFILLTASPLGAEVKTFLKEYTYQASEADSKIFSRVMALEQVKRLLLEEMGTYLESQTEVRNFQISNDRVMALSAGIVKTEIVEERWDGREYYVKARMTVETENIAQALDALRKDAKATGEMEKIRAMADQALQEVEKLKKQMALNPNGKAESLNAYNQSINRLSATDWFQKARQYERAGDYRQALEAYNKVIELNPKFSEAYNNRGIIYSERQGNKGAALADFTRAIELNPNDAVVYNNRGFLFHRSGNDKQAIQDYDRALTHDPRYVQALLNRGLSYAQTGNNQQALADFSKALEIDPKSEMGYYNRAIIYGMQQEYRKSIADLDKVIELNGTNGDAYFKRAIGYANLDDTEQANRDVLTAARMGNKQAQSFLRGKGKNW